ncbi:MAG: aminopeptidase N [Pseudomonadota bacterium]
MRDANPSQNPQIIYLKDYRPPAYWVESVHLTFRLAPNATRVVSKVTFRPNPDAPGPFELHGENLTPVSFAIDGAPVTPEFTDTGLCCSVPDGPFVWEAEVEIDPAANTALEGLYMSNGMYCTQCEAEGFRKITWYPDRPDVMAPFTVRIEGDQPVLLSNGNPTGSGDGWAEWTDPWPKPAYLFALVAGDLQAHRDRFTTKSGQTVDLAIWVRAGDIGKCAFAMDALKRSMLWDERVYGREYDLSVFNIVAVDDFNMGAMENKGLNVFNSSAVLASPETATDSNFERIESIIAHEYFHNWTGNRITCRDWFQLCLKEGLTVFRDQQFSADERSASVQRIQDVLALRARQFREDNGPLAHAVRPESFVEINNFYTATVYEKGAEVIGMLRRLVGAEGYAKALNLYFERHDGQACTIEDWLQVFEDATGRDLSQFKRWYSQAGTPRVTMSESWDESTFTLTLSQDTPPTPGQDEKLPQVIPVAVGLLAKDGSEICPTTILELSDAEQSFEFPDLTERPVASVLRGFSAPVILERDISAADQALLLAHDSDPFNRWEAARDMARASLLAMIGEGAAPDPAYLAGLSQVLNDATLDPAFRALCLRLPDEDDLAEAIFSSGAVPDPDKIYAARERMGNALSARLSDRADPLYAQMSVPGPYRPDAEDAGKRALQAALLGLITRQDHGDQARIQFRTADNMTQSMAALSALVKHDLVEEELDDFETRWREDRLVMDKWFALQVSLAPPAKAVDIAEKLVKRPDFDWKNPNRFRAVIGGLAMNRAGFHDVSGRGYGFVADWLCSLDPVNPQTTARMTTLFETWRRYDPARQDMMKAALGRLQNLPELSRDSTEMVSRILGGK